MNADQRVTAAREYLDYARKVHVADFPHSPLTRMAAELRRQLGQVLDVAAELEADPDTGRLAAIRAVLARFDWERDDRQYALEEIERIAGGVVTASYVRPDGSADVSAEDVLTILAALADGAWWQSQHGAPGVAARYRSLSRSLGDDRG